MPAKYKQNNISNAAKISKYGAAAKEKPLQILLHIKSMQHA